MTDEKNDKPASETPPSEKKPKKPGRKKKTPPTEEELASPRTDEQFRLSLRRTTRMYYDVQAMRLQALGRLTKKAPGATIELHPRDLQRLTARVADLELAEKNMLADLDDQLHEVPFYRDVIEPGRSNQFRGLGPRMASVIVSSFDIAREETVSQMWAFAGLRPMPCKRCKLCFVQLAYDEEKRAYKHGSPTGNKCTYKGQLMTDDSTNIIDSAKAQRPVAGEKLNYNAWLRTKLCGVLGDVMLKVKSPYRYFYYAYKQRWVSANKGTSDAHRHKAAIRYMIKCLLADIYTLWRTFEKLPVRPSYQEEYLKHEHRGSYYDTAAKGLASLVDEPISPELVENQTEVAEEVLEVEKLSAKAG